MSLVTIPLKEVVKGGPADRKNKRWILHEALLHRREVKSRETVREISDQRTSQRSPGSMQQFPKQTGPSFPASAPLFTAASVSSSLSLWSVPSTQRFWSVFCWFVPCIMSKNTYLSHWYIQLNWFQSVTPSTYQLPEAIFAMKIPSTPALVEHRVP